MDLDSHSICFITALFVLNTLSDTNSTNMLGHENADVLPTAPALLLGV